MGNFNMLSIGQYSVWLGILALWVIPWKGYALWKSARRGEKWWFIVLLVVNTAAILEILYIFVFSKMMKKEVEEGGSAEGEEMETGEEKKM